MYSFHLFLMSFLSTKSPMFLSLIAPIFGQNVPLIFPIFLKRSLDFPLLLFSSIFMHCSLKKAFLSLLAILWNSAFSWMYLSLSLYVYVCVCKYIIYESESHSVVSDSLRPHGLYSPWNSPGQNIGVGSLALLQGIFPTQGLNSDLLYCRQILYQLSHQGSPCGWPLGKLVWPKKPVTPTMSVACVISEMPGSWLHSHRHKASQGMNTVIDNGLQHFPVHAPFKHLIMTKIRKRWHPQTIKQAACLRG